MFADRTMTTRRKRSNYFFSDLRTDKAIIIEKVKEFGGTKFIANEIGISKGTLYRYLSSNGVMQKSKIYRLYDYIGIEY